MKRHISLFVFFCLPGVFLAGCSDADRSSLMGEEEVPGGGLGRQQASGGV